MSRKIVKTLASQLVVFGIVCLAAGAIVNTRGNQAGQTPAGQSQNPLQAQIDLGADFTEKPPIKRLDPIDEQKHFQLPPGFRIEPVLTDPVIEDPVGITFDGNGRMYVLEMRSYMRDADGSNSREPISRISRHEDTNGDGTYDTHTVFADKLVLPRIAFPLGNGEVLVLETDNRDLYKLTDSNGDGVADKREVFYPGYGRVTNMEWQPGGLTWALDNWLYTTYNPFRLRLAAGGKIVREETEPNGGQWWSAQDNYGKMWWVDGGGEIGPVNFQTPIIYGAFNVADNFEPDFQVPNPAPGGISDMQGGMRRVRLPDGTLNHFTAASGAEIYRGHRMPSDMVGDLFFTEPVGRIVRRAKVVVTDGLTQLKNAYPGSEFVRSTDPLFRPVSITTGPDGALYLMDMYTGIIQDAQFVGPNSYLRQKIEQYQLDKQHNWGRIWRITHEETPLDHTRPQMYSQTPNQLVQHLTHPSGWWRDTAQKLLVLGRDKSVVPALRTMARTSANQLARIHALWTLEGLDALDAALVRELMKSPDPKVRIQSMRASESLYKAGDKSFAVEYRNFLEDADTDVVIQAMLTLNLYKVPDSGAMIKATISGRPARGIKEIGEQILKGTSTSQGQRPALSDTGAGAVNLSVDARRSVQRGETAYREICAACHGIDGKGAPMAGAPAGITLAPPLAGSPRVQGHRDYVIKVLMNGLMGPINGADYTAVMVPLGANSDEWIADVASFVRIGFGNTGSIVKPSEVTLVRKVSDRKTPWTVAELESTLPIRIEETSTWKLTASHNGDAAGNPINGAGRWDSGAPQQPGMWYQIELPAATRISEVQLDSAVPFSFAGGRRGRGAAPGRGGPGPAGARGGAPPAPAAGPVRYKVQVSMDGSTWSDAAEGDGQTPTTVIAFAPTESRFIRITETAPARNNEQWAIAAVRVYRVGDK
jgi:glucose/arabinose dehydrogenase/mono/diheme cytochrome c family protein